MTRDPIQTWYFALVIVRLGDRFLLVQERKYDQSWYIPAGRVEPGETFAAAAQRETLEEAGIPIVLEGILRIEHKPEAWGVAVQGNVLGGMARLRVIYVARPADNTPPKTIADQHSLGANWFSLEQIESLPLRGEEVYAMLQYVDNHAPIYPLDLITTEGAAFTIKSI